MKLELKHLAPYLPYRLKIQHIKEKSRAARKEKLSPFTKTLEPLDLTPFFYGEDDFKYKPILRPLSDLTKEEYNFIWENETDFDIVESWVNSSFDLESKLGWKFSYHLWSELFKNHFDVFGLIDKGLAIDINTLEK